MRLFDDYIKQSKNSSYLSNLNFGSPSSRVDIPFLHIINSDLIEQTLNTNGRLAVIMPNSFQSANWSIFLTALSILKKGFSKQNLEDRYSKGQILLFNKKCVVEFLEFLDEGGLKIKASDAIYTINKKFQGQLKAINTKKALSPIKKIRTEEAQLTESSHPVDRLLNVTSMGDMATQDVEIILCTKTGSAIEFFTKRKIGDYPINEIINFGKINLQGKVSPLGSGQAANINVLLTNDPFNIDDYISKSDNQDRPRIVLFDKISTISNNYGTIRDLFSDYNVSASLILDYSEMDKYSVLNDLDFSIWHWSPEKFQSLPVNAEYQYFDKINSAIKKYKDYDITLELLEFPLLANIFDHLKGVERNIPDDQYAVKEGYITIYHMVLLFSRMVFVPDEDFVNGVVSRLNAVRSNLKRHKAFIDKTVHETLIICMDCFMDIISDFQKQLSQKNEKIHEIIKSKKYNEYNLLVQKSEHKSMVEQYWGNILSEENFGRLNIISISELMNGELFNHYRSEESVLIVCGWLNRKNMNKVFTDQIALSKIILLFYVHEYRWYLSLKEHWKSVFTSLSRNKATLNGLDFKTVQKRERVFFPKIQEEDKSDFDIIDFEDRINNYSNAKYSAGKKSEELLKTSKIFFGYDRIMFATESHKFFILNDLFDAADNIDIKTTDKIEPNSTIILSHASRDLIKNKADELLREDGLSKARDLAYLWRKELRQYIIDGEKIDYGKVVPLALELKENGCLVHHHTLRSWLYDENRIGPQNFDVIDVISKITNSDLMKNQLPKIRQSIRIIRKYHQRAAFAIKTSLFDKIKTFLDNLEIEDLEKKDYFKIDTEEFGEILILKILDIDHETKYIDPQYVNKLIEEVEEV